MNWVIKTFEQLSAAELHDILKLRQDIFIIEQTCIYPDIDGADPKAHHIYSYGEQELAAYTRIFAPGIKYTESSIGRIVVSETKRGSVLGRKLVKESISECLKLYPKTPIRIEAQAHLEKFYNELGFQSVGEVYIVDGIDHREMVYNP